MLSMFLNFFLLRYVAYVTNVIRLMCRIHVQKYSLNPPTILTQLTPMLVREYFGDVEKKK